MQKVKVKNNSLSSYLLKKKNNKEKILLAFLPALYPDKGKSLKLINFLLDNGVDALELGFPVLDAKKDGKTISKANKKVVNNGFKAADYFQLAAEVNKNREYNRLAVMGYWDNLKLYFQNEYQHKWQEAGIKDLIIPDLEEKYIDTLRELGYNLVPFLDSVKKIKNYDYDEEAFLYFPTHKGKTGVNNNFDLKLLQNLKNESIKSGLSEKIHLAGFGIHSADDVKKIIALDFDGVIVGSEFINKINQDFEAFKLFLEELKTALNKE